MRKRDTIENVFTDVRNKVVRNAYVPYSMIRKFNIEHDKVSGEVKISRIMNVSKDELHNN